MLMSIVITNCMFVQFVPRLLSTICMCMVIMSKGFDSQDDLLVIYTETSKKHELEYQGYWWIINLCIATLVMHCYIALFGDLQRNEVIIGKKCLETGNRCFALLSLLLFGSTTNTLWQLHVHWHKYVLHSYSFISYSPLIMVHWPQSESRSCIQNSHWIIYATYFFWAKETENVRGRERE